MKVLLATDSRGDYTTDGSTPWIHRVRRALPHHDIQLFERGTTDPKRALLLNNVWGIARALEAAHASYDVIVMQTGLHEFLRPYSKSVWKHVVPNFREENLVDVGRGAEYLYRDRESLAAAVGAVKRHARTVAFVATHSFLKRHPPQFDASMSNRLVRELNVLFADLVDDVLFLPSWGSWAADVEHPADHVHFNNATAADVATLVTVYLERLELTLPALLERAEPSRMIEVRGERRRLGELVNDAMIAGATVASCTAPGDHVAVALRTSVGQLAAFVGAMLFGRIPFMLAHPSVKVHPAEFAKKLDKVDRVLHPSLCLCDEQDRPWFTERWRCPPTLDPTHAAIRPPAPEPRSIAFAQLSSGTTGLPKVVTATHKQLIDHVLTYGEHIGFDGGRHVVASWLPLYHDMGLVASFLLPLLHGASFVHIHPFDWLARPTIFFDKIAQYRATHVWLPNFAFPYLTRVRTSVDLSSLEQVISCSEVTHPAMLRRFADVFAPNGFDPDALRVCYAMAENVFAVAQSTELGHRLHAGRPVASCGRILPGTSLIVMNGAEDVTEAGVGDLYLRSSYEPSSNQADGCGYYPTGDVGFIEDGEVFVLGRSDDMIVTFGRNVFPYEVEETVSGIAGVIPGRVACFGVEHESKGTQEVWVCAEVTDTGDPALRAAIGEAVYAQLGLGSTVRLFPPGTLTKTSSGKLSRKACREVALGWQAIA